MATVLTLRNTTTSGITDTGDGVLYDLLVNTFGAAEDLDVTDTAAAGTNIQWSQSAGGPTIAWISGRVPAGGFTLTSTTLSVWWAESHMNANAGGRFRVYRYQPGTPTITEIGSFDNVTELVVTTLTEESIVGNVTDTAFAENDRILLRLFVRNVGTMASGHTCTVGFNGANGSQSDSTLTIAETVAFKANDLRVTPAAEGVSVSEVVAAILPERRAQISWIEFEVPEGVEEPGEDVAEGTLALSGVGR